MPKNNRDDFNQCTALVFELLYNHFPQEIEIIIDDLVQPFDESQFDNYCATLRFLQREGFIRYQTLNYDAFTGVVLTTKGLKILDTIPAILLEEKTIAQQISIALQQKSETAVETIIKELIRQSA